MRRAPLAIAAIVAALAGCGNDKEESSGSVTLTRGAPVVVEGDEYAFKPGTITIRGGGGPVRFELHNRGTLPHDIHVRKGDEELGGSEAVSGGDTARATVDLEPGEYEIYCSIGDHADLGMRGDLTIE